MVLREHKDPLNTSRGIMGPLENSAGVQNNRGRLKQRFDLIRKLGQGTYGKVQLGIDKETGQEVAIKTIKKSKIETEADLIRIRREIQIMSSVRHPNIIHIYEVFENREKMVLVTEYASGGELYDYLNERKILQEDEARRIFRQIASAVYYCHKNKICHRDLKLENILLDEKSNAKIADFGLSNVFDDVNLLKTFCGSPLYASPEIVKGTPYCGPEVDCWSLGVLLYTLVYGAMPFDGSNFKRLVKQISAGDYYEPKKPAEASSLIKIMLTVDPLKRAKVDDICAHSWINQGFDENCLKSAEDLAKQTPVRLDVLLTLAPNHNINHSQVVIAEPDGKDHGEGASKALTNHVTNHAESDSTVNDPPKKPKLQGDVGQKESTSATPSKPKRKSQIKTKSKTTPLMLDLIQDVVEEETEGDVEMQCVQPPPPQPQQQAPAVAGVGAKGDDDDEGDTLSEISEIQTLAEDLENAKPSRRKSVKGSAAAGGDSSHESRSKGTKTTASSNAQKVINKTEPVAVVAQAKPTEVKAVPEKPLAETTTVNATTTVPTPAEVPSTKTVVKKKVVKPKVPEEKPKEEVAAVAVAQDKPKEKESPAAPKVEEKPSIVEEVKKPAPTKAKSSTPESPERQNSEEKTSDNEKKKLMRQRSGSSEVSPTRVERRNSKVISQKTAELIQNLETKATTSGGSSAGSGRDSSTEGRPPGIKKLVIPSFNKISDAKNKFETKPPIARPLGSSFLSQSKAAFEAKAQPAKPPLPTQSSIDKEKAKEKEPAAKPDVQKEKETLATPQPPKAKSPSPTPKDTEKPAAASSPAAALAAPETPKENATSVSPKTKPKVVKKVTQEEVKPPVEAPVAAPPQQEKEPDKPKPAEAAVDKPVAPVAKKGPGKIQIPAGLQAAQAKPEVVKPVMIDAGKGGPKPVAMVVKGKPTSTVVPPTPPTPATPTPETPATPSGEKVMVKMPPQNKEQAARKISSVINKIVTSGSADEKKFKPETPLHKTEVSFPVSAAQSTERVIPIKFESESPPENQMSPPPSASGSRTQIHRFPPRLDSFKKFDSASSIFSRQNSSDTESCSLAPPKPEPIRKSPREFLIPIKLEGSGQTVTPKEDVASDPTAGGGSEDEFRIDSRLRSGRFGRAKRYSSLLSDSSLDEEPSVSVSQGQSTRTRASAASMGVGEGVAMQSNHSRSRSQGDEPETTPAATFKRYRIKRPDLDRSDSFSSAEEDDEDFFEVLTADSLFSNLLDRVRNLTKRINREGSMGPNWPTGNNDPTNFGLWNPSSSLRDLMNRAPSESMSFGTTNPSGFSVSSHRSFSREPSVSVTINTGGGGPGGTSGWRRSLSRDVSGDSDASGSINPPSRNYGGGKPLSTEIFETTSVRSLPLSLQTRRSPSYMSQRSEPFGDLSPSSSASRQSLYSGGAGSGTTGTSRPLYGRTMSNTEYGMGNPTSGISRTLPLRRSLKTFERGPPSLSGMDSMDSMLGAIKGLGQSLIDSPATFDPDSYLRQLRSMSRDREWDRESSVSKMSSISEQEQDPFIRDSSVSIGPSEGGSVNDESEGSRLSVQEKMNNYQQYYQNLTSPSPLKRFQLTSPNQQQNHQQYPNGSGTNVSLNSNGVPLQNVSSSSNVGIGLAKLRPSTMYETYNANGAPCQQSVNQTNISVESSHAVGDNYPSPQLPNTNRLEQHYASQNQSGQNLLMKAKEPSPNSTTDATDGNQRKMSNANANTNPKWPGVSIQQYRPLSISSFPNNDESSQQGRPVPPPPPVRMMSPPPTMRSSTEIDASLSPNSNTNLNSGVNTVKKRESAGRATSVERITRFLERKSVPREVTPGPPSTPQNKTNDSKPQISQTCVTTSTSDNCQTTPPAAPSTTTDQSQNSPSEKPSKLSKPKFLQSLEKKWEKFTHKSDDHNKNHQEIQQSNVDDTPQSDEISNEDTKISESVLLRRAVSPEKKLKKFGSGTVNFMLGKFKNFEPSTSSSSSNLASPPAISQSKLQPPSGKPPAGNPSRIGRRVQSVYAGAASDSVLALPSTQYRIPTPKTLVATPVAPPPPTEIPSAEPPLVNGHHQNDEVESIEADLIRSAEMAQQKRRSVRLDTRSASPAPSGPPVPSPKPQRPYSLGVFSDSKSSSMIPRPHGVTLRSSSPQGNLSPPLTSNPEPIKSMSPPEITIHHDQDVTSPMQSPTSISDSVDSSSVCSDKNDLGKASSLAGDDEESVSDRIFRKSFYSRFNSIDRAKRSSSLSAATAARRGLQPMGGVSNSVIHTRAPSMPKESSKENKSRPFHMKAQSVDRTLSPQPGGNKGPAYRAFSPGPSNSIPENPPVSNSPINGHSSPPTIAPTTPAPTNGNNNHLSVDLTSRPKSPSPHTLVINKYNPNPLFKELITDDFKTDIEKKTEYSRKVTSKLSKLLKEIESDLNTCNLRKSDDGDDDDINNDLRPVSPNIGVGLKAISGGQHNNTEGLGNGGGQGAPQRRYGGSKTTHLAVDSANSILNRRNQLLSKNRDHSPVVQRARTPTAINSGNNNNSSVVNGTGGGTSDGSSSNNNSNDSMTSER